MAKSYGKNSGRRESHGGFGALPRVVWKNPDYHRLTGSAVKLLMDLACQYNGKNNGDLTVAYSIVNDRGCGAKDTITRAVRELLEARMIIQTREGLFTNPGAKCALYALSWLPVNECQGKGLSVDATAAPLRAFSMEKFIKNPGPESGRSSSQNLGRLRPRDTRGRFSSA